MPTQKIATRDIPFPWKYTKTQKLAKIASLETLAECDMLAQQGCLKSLQRLCKQSKKEWHKRKNESKSKTKSKTKCKEEKSSNVDALDALETLLYGRVCASAAANGHFSTLKWLCKYGFPLGKNTCAFAADKGHFEIVKWAHNQGCAWDKTTCQFAARNGHNDILVWAHNNGCPWDNCEGCSRASSHGHRRAAPKSQFDK